MVHKQKFKVVIFKLLINYQIIKSSRFLSSHDDRVILHVRHQHIDYDKRTVIATNNIQWLDIYSPQMHVRELGINIDFLFVRHIKKGIRFERLRGNVILPILDQHVRDISRCSSDKNLGSLLKNNTTFEIFFRYSLDKNQGSLYWRIFPTLKQHVWDIFFQV
jgi:hypothetical protein